MLGIENQEGTDDDRPSGAEAQGVVDGVMYGLNRLRKKSL
jgi:hypothetical protein